jgi:hypothetical protein
MPLKQNNYIPQIHQTGTGDFFLGFKSIKDGVIGWFTDLKDMKIRSV